MEYNNFRKRCVDLNYINDILGLLINYKIPIIYVGPHEDYKKVKLEYKDFSYTKYAILKENEGCIWVETGYFEVKKKPTRYIFWLDGNVRPAFSGQQAFAELQRNCFKATHVKNYNYEPINRQFNHETGRYAFSAGPLIDYNRKYEGQNLYNVYEYDLNSAYSSIMLQHIPNVNKPYFNTYIKAHQVGFNLDDKCTMITTPGCFAEVVFDLIELNADQRKYIEKLYLKKEQAVSEEETAEAKLMLNASIGYYQRFNPFIRAYIVHKCNEFISGLLDDNSILWNTDAIFSLKRRPELELGNKIGQFKETFIFRFAYKGNNYQINNEKPKYRGICGWWFPEHWDILRDEVPERCNKYKLENNRIIENKEYYEKVNQKAIN